MEIDPLENVVNTILEVIMGIFLGLIIIGLLLF